jgi:hypothetical protein
MGRTQRLSGGLRRTLPLWTLALLLVPCLSGCAAIGVIAAKVLPPASIPPKYKGLNDQSVAVLVWVDRGIKIDWPQIQLDAAAGIQNKLQQAQKDRASEVSGTKFPASAATVVRFQEEHPEWAADSIEEVAPRLNVSRVIYVEINNFQTRSEASVELFRGTLTATVRVLEVSHGKARVVHTEEDVRAIFPEKGPEEGTPGLGDFEVYRRTIDGFTTGVANLFVTHMSEEP